MSQGRVYVRCFWYWWQLQVEPSSEAAESGSPRWVEWGWFSPSGGYLSPCPLQASHLESVLYRAVGMQGVGDKIQCDSAVSPTLQSHILLWAHEAAPQGESGEGLPVLWLGSGELGKVEYVQGKEPCQGCSALPCGGVEGCGAKGGRGFPTLLHCSLEPGS